MSEGLNSPALADPASLTAEERRLREARAGVPWRAWGPYLSERQWGTVREDYSDSEDAWSYLSHDQARSRAYRWGEDGIAGISDDKQRLCLAVAFAGTFLRDSDGRRPVYGGTKLFQEDPYWRDLILFYEYYHGDNGAGLGASHLTGWSGLVARLIQSMGQFDADSVLEDSQWPMARPYRRLAAGSMPDVTTAREARGATEP